MHPQFHRVLANHRSDRVAFVRGESFIGAIDHRVVKVFVRTLRQWREALAAKWRSSGA